MNQHQIYQYNLNGLIGFGVTVVGFFLFIGVMAFIGYKLGQRNYRKGKGK